MDVKHNKNFAKQFHNRYRQALPSAMRGTEGFESIEDFSLKPSPLLSLWILFY